MSAKHTYSKINSNTVTAKSIYVGAEFDAQKLCMNKDNGINIGLYVTFNNNTIGHIALKDMGLPPVGEEFFRQGKLHFKFNKSFKVIVTNTESTAKLIGTGKQMYDLQVL
jgi:hypothetical protein